jgi:hypothetical protein
MPRRIVIAATMLLSAAVIASACGGSSKKDATTTPAKAESTSAARTAVATTAAKTTPAAAAAASSAAAAATAAPANTPGAPSSSSGKTYNAIQAKVLLDDASLTPKDLTGPVWNSTSDVMQDNAAAAAADPKNAASNERCGRLLGRTVNNQPKDIVSAFLGGESVAQFSTITVYATEAGAIDCATEAATRYQQSGELARAFGPTFVDPVAVQVAIVDYPQVADGSFAATLTGQVNAAGTVVDITILLVGFRKGNVSAAVGAAHSAGSIPTSEVTPLVNLVLQRISANQ